ncbi:MAG: hypothetical protein Ct9H300mP28_31320 [Pseudomonadota bacterium]|nr:MAG: hypothetical protein Ct9H300mP28_31320 [Pseudomonadota bacterium]
MTGSNSCICQDQCGLAEDNIDYCCGPCDAKQEKIGLCQCSFGIKKEWAQAVSVFKTGFNPYSQTAFKIK